MSNLNPITFQFRCRFRGTNLCLFIVHPFWTFMVFAEDIRTTILKLADERGAGNAFSPKDVACRVDKKNAQELLEVVYFVASVLIKEGKIASVRAQGKSADLPLYIKSN
jgi:Protein of unknown function (DUF3253)